MRRIVAVWIVSVSAVSGVTVPAGGQWTELAKLTASDAAMMDTFGCSVGVSGNTVIVGALSDNGLGADAGAAYVFNTTTGEEYLKLTAPDGEASDLFGTSVAVSCNVAIVGAPEHYEEGVRCGSAYLFNVTTGQLLHELIASDADSHDYFGYSVAISGNRALIGAYGNDDVVNRSGSAYLFDVSTGQELFKLAPLDVSIDTEFGHAVAIDGNVAVVGTYRDNHAGVRSGSAYLFDVTTGQQLDKLIASDAEVGQEFGCSVAVSGNTVVVGARLAYHTAQNAGAAYLFDATTGREFDKLTVSDPGADHAFGSSVAMSGNTALIGAPGVSGMSGSAFLFDVTTGRQLQELTASDPTGAKQFGNAVAIGGNAAIIGAIGDDAEAVGAGAAYLSRLSDDSGFRLNGNPVPESQLSNLALPMLPTGDTLSGQGTRSGAFLGQAGSAIVVDEGDMTLGDPESYAGFSTEGTIDVRTNTLTLRTAGFAALGVQTTIGGGTLEAPGGVVLGVGDNLVGHGAVDAKVAAAAGSTIAAAGNLSLGDDESPAGFFSDGHLPVGAHTVTLLDQNEALLGSLTTLGENGSPGVLQSAHGLIIELGKNLTGYGTVETPDNPATPLVNNGFVGGRSSDEPIELEGHVKGVGNFGHVVIAGTLSPGLSPAEVAARDLVLADTATLVMEIAGEDAGGEHDVLHVTGNAALDGTLRVELIGGFRPRPADAFDLFHFNTAAGRFAALDLPPLPGELAWDTSSLYTSGRIAVVPEPPAVGLLCVVVSFLLVLGNRGRTTSGNR